MGKKRKKLEELPDLLPCPICGNTELYTGPMSCDSMGVHCMYGGDDIVSIVMRLNKGNKRAQQKFLESPELQGCGLKLSRDYPDIIPKELRHKNWADTDKALKHTTLLAAIKVWNSRCESKDQ